MKLWIFKVYKDILGFNTPVYMVNHLGDDNIVLYYGSENKLITKWTFIDSLKEIGFIEFFDTWRSIEPISNEFFMRETWEW